MLQEANVLFNQILTFAKANPIIASAFGLWGLSALTFFFKDIPRSIINFLVRQSTTTLDLNSQDLIYHEFLEWMSKNKMHSFVRTININNGIHHGRYGDSSRGLSGISLGYGSTYFRHGWNVFRLTRSKVESSATDIVKESISLTVFNRSHKVFKELFASVVKTNEDDKQFTKIYSFKQSQGWNFVCRNFKRDPTTVVLEDAVENRFYSSIDKFLGNRKWYAKNGVPYRLGILLEGPPGTGKTSLIKAVCAKYDRPLYLLSLNNLSDSNFLDAMADLPEQCIVAIEDIDAFGVNLHRKNKNGKSMETLTMSGLLNGIDGAASAENRILIATTNHPEKLDPALLRDGRFDVKVRLDNMTTASFFKYMKTMYDDFSAPKNYTLPTGVSAASVQSLVFHNQNDYKVVLKALKAKV